MIDKNNFLTEQDFLKYSSLEEFRTKLEELRNTDFANLDTKKVGEIIFDYLTVIPSISCKYEPAKFNRFKFYRTRLNIDESTEDLGLIRTYSYPPPQFCKENGRANIKYKSIFYSTNCALTAIIESKPKPGDIGYLSFWKGCTDREMKAGILLPRSLNPQNEWYVLAEDMYRHVNENIAKIGIPLKASFFHEALDFISNLYLVEKIPYPITSWISTELIYGTAWKDFIIYPSFANKAYSSNIAIHPNVADQYIKFEKVIRFKVLKVNGQNLSVSTGRVGELVQNNIKWRTATREELDFSLFPGFESELTQSGLGS